MDLSVGTVIWKMVGHKKDGKIYWFAKPNCIEVKKRGMYMFGDGAGVNENGIGNTYFLTRKECIVEFLKNHESLITEDPAVPAKKTFSLEDVVIYPNYEEGMITKIIVDDQLYDQKSLLWNYDPNFASNCESSGKYLRLKDLSEQLHDKGRVIMVIRESPLNGDIYLYGNYNDDKWYHHGTTRGFA